MPQIIAGPAGKAISRLIGATVDIPIAYLEGITQGIRDKNDARSLILKNIANNASELAASDPEILERAVNNLLSRSYRIQKNKDAVAIFALNDLKINPPTSESEGPSEDWITKFEKYAEDASTEDLRLLYGKILAGEIRNPGSVSPATLHFTSMLDENTAKLIERVLPTCTSASISFFEILKPSLSIAEITFIEQSGFWSAEKSYKVKFDTNGVFLSFAAEPNLGFALRGTPDTEIYIDVAVLSRAGADFVKIIGKSFDFKAFASFILQKEEVTNFYFGKIEQVGSLSKIVSPTELFQFP